MDNGQSAIGETCMDPFAVAVVVEVLPYSLVVEGGQDLLEGSDSRWGFRGSNTRVECNHSVIKLSDTGIAAVGGRAFSSFFLDTPLTVSGYVWVISTGIDVVQINFCLLVLVINYQIVL